MPAPSELPEWASGGGADITDPVLAKKQSGWVVEQPAHDVFNWWMNNVFKWVQWLSANPTKNVPNSFGAHAANSTSHGTKTGLVQYRSPQGLYAIEGHFVTTASFATNSDIIANFTTDPPAASQVLYGTVWTGIALGSPVAYPCYINAAGQLAFDAGMGVTVANATPCFVSIRGYDA